MHKFTCIRLVPRKICLYKFGYKLASSTQHNIIDFSYLGLKSSLGVGVQVFYILPFQVWKNIEIF